MCQADGAWFGGSGPAAEEGGRANGVVGRYVGGGGDNMVGGGSGYGVHDGGFHLFRLGQWWEQGGDAFGDHGFAGAAGADEQEIVATGGGYFRGEFCLVLAGHLVHVEMPVGVGRPRRLVWGDVGEFRPAIGPVDDVGDRGGGEHINSRAEEGFVGVSFRDDDGFYPGGAGRQDGGQDAGHGPEATVESDFAKHHGVGEAGAHPGIGVGCGENSDGDGGVEVGAGFGNIAGEEAHHDLGFGPGEF